MDAHESEIRLRVLRDSLELENYTTFWLGIFLDIESASSKSLGNSSNAISLNSKVNLLIDQGALSNEEKNQFLRLMEIRNQFMHNPKATTFVDCYSFINGIENWFLKKYIADDSLTKEEQFSTWYNDLSRSVRSKAAMIFNKASEKLEQRETDSKYRLAFKLLAAELPKLLDAIYEANPSPALMEKTREFTDKYLKNLLVPPVRKTYNL
ncbi:MAG: hypothetical protein ABIN89_30360 [Chitinophagaceae bacterium]